MHKKRAFCSNVPSAISPRRELDALVVAADELKCENLTLITWNTDETVNHKGKDITVVSVRSWFLNIAHD